MAPGMSEIAVELGIARRELPVNPISSSCRVISLTEKICRDRKNIDLFFAPLATIL